MIPLDKLRQNLDQLPKDAEIIIHCEISARALQAQRILEWYGYKDVKFIDGSITAWPYDDTVSK